MITAKTDNARNLPAWLSRCALRTIVPQRVESSPIESPRIGCKPRLTNYGNSFLILATIAIPGLRVNRARRRAIMCMPLTAPLALVWNLFGQ
jgi:hypothetical protein